MLLSQRLLKDRPPPHPSSKIADALKRAGVQRTAEFERVNAIPRRPAPPAEIPDLTEVFRKPGGTLNLWPVQSWALLEAERAGGLFGILSCGSGKTLITVILPDVLGAERAVLLVPPALRRQLLDVDIPYYGKHFNLPLDRLTVLSYFDLSSPDGTSILDELEPDLIIADECHALRAGKNSARGRRFTRYVEQHPKTRFCGLSGTVTNRSIVDYAALLRFALKESCPLPEGDRELIDWAKAIDVGDEPMPPGVLLHWTERMYQLTRGSAVGGLVVRDDVIVEAAPVFRSLVGQPATVLTDAVELGVGQTEIRAGYRRRLIETPGVVSTAEAEVGASLIVRRMRPKIPQEVATLLASVRATGRIDDEELEDPIALGRVLRQIACGFHYRWIWPNGEKDWDWLEARSKWHKEVRTRLLDAQPGLDSPFLLATAAAAGRITSETWPAWDAQRSKPEPPVEVVWASNFIVDAAVEWATLGSAEFPGIIWYEHDALGRQIAKKSGLPFYGPGEEASRKLAVIDARKEPVIVASIKAHGTGKNLQAYEYALVTTPPASGQSWEQLCARLHRPGQKADEVTFDVFTHTTEYQGALASAIDDARFVFETTGARQKLLAARIVDEDEG